MRVGTNLRTLALLIGTLSGSALAGDAPEVKAPSKSQVEPPRYRVSYSTYFGGNEWDQAREVIPLPDGTVLVGAQVCSAGLPTTEGVLQPKYAGDDPTLGHGGIHGGDCFLLRLSLDSDGIQAGTYFGGSRQERNVYGMQLDKKGNIVITTATRSSDAPTTEGSFQPRYGGGPSDMLVAKIAPDLKRLLWCTYVGGKGDDFPRGGLTLDSEENVYVGGTSNSTDFPTTPGAFQTELKGPRDSAVVKLRADGTGLVFGTLLGGSGEDDAVMGLCLDDAGNVHLAGHTRSDDFPVTKGAAQEKLGGQSDAYIAKLAADGSSLLHATYLGGRLNEFAEHRLWLGQWDTVLVTGFTGSPDFPTTRWAVQRTLRGKGDGFITKLSRDGERLMFSTFLGGSGNDFWLMPILDADDNLLVVGSTSSPDFPVTPDALQSRYAGDEDGALVILTPDGSTILYATYLGGSGKDMVRSVALGPAGEVYLVGSTASEDFPVTENAVQAKHGGKGDVFVVKLEGLPVFSPGKWISLFDGKTLAGWRPFVDEDYPDLYGKVQVQDGSLILDSGSPMTGVRWARNVPRDNYEMTLEGRRVEGGDFFCGLTFPVGDSPLTLILGGWGGSIVGLSNVDSYSAVENETTTSMTFENGQWYAIRLRVTSEKIQVWIDDERKIDLSRAGHEFTVWPQQEEGRPLGITTYYTRGAFRSLRLRRLELAED